MKVKLKTEKQLKKLVKNGDIELIEARDGQALYAIQSGAVRFLFRFHTSSHDQVYEVVDADRCMTKGEYDPRRIMFAEVKE